MTTYTLTVSTDDLGLGVINGARVAVDRKRTQVTDVFNGQSLSKNSVATNSSGIATIPLEPDDGSVYHELKIFDLAGILVYSKIFIMPPQAISLSNLPVQDIISASATQAVAASVTATAQAVIATTKAEEASISETNASDSENAAAASKEAALGYLNATVAAVTESLLHCVNIAALRLKIGTDIAYNNAKTLGYFEAGDGGDTLFYWNSASALDDNGGTVIKPTAVSAAGRWVAVNTTKVNPLQFGAYGDSSTDDSYAIKNMLSCGASVFDFLDKQYLISTTNGSTFSTFLSKTRISIIGDGALLIDSTTHTSSGMTILFNFNACSNIKVKGVNYKGQQLASPSDAVNGIGYKGATFVNLKNACFNIEVDADLTDCRYGVRCGDYSTFDEGYNYNIATNITALRVGYANAYYLAQDFDIRVVSVSGHRAVYLAGCHRGNVDAYVKNQYIAPIQVLLTDAKTGTSTSRGCSSIKTTVRDMGSTAYPPNSWLVGIALSRVDPGTTFADLHFHVYLKSTDTVASSVGAFIISSSAKTYEPSYPYNWEQTIYLKNISVSGLIDRSEQTTATHELGEVYISTIDTGSHYATSSGFNFNQLKIINGSGSNPHGLYFLLDGLTDSCKFNQCDFGNYALECRAPVTGWPVGFIFNDCNTITRTTANTSSAVPFAFNNTNISDLTQPLAYSKMSSATVKSAGLKIITIVKDITLTGASVSLASFIPAGATVIGVSGIVTTAITGATGYTVGVAAEAARYCNTNTLTVGSTFTPSAQSATELSPRVYLSFTDIVVTAKTSNFTAGSLRVSLTYGQISAPSL